MRSFTVYYQSDQWYQLIVKASDMTMALRKANKILAKKYANAYSIEGVRQS